MKPVRGWPFFLERREPLMSSRLLGAGVGLAVLVACLSVPVPAAGKPPDLVRIRIEPDSVLVQRERP